MSGGERTRWSLFSGLLREQGALSSALVLTGASIQLGGQTGGGGGLYLTIILTCSLYSACRNSS